jgi:hypothetical protein
VAATETLIRTVDGEQVIDTQWDHDPRCDGRGWAGTDGGEAPRPCLDCKPWLRAGSGVPRPVRTRRSGR